MNKATQLVFAGAVIIIAVTVIYLLIQNQALVKKLQSNPSPIATTIVSNQATQESTTQPTPTLAQTEENIKAAINSRNTQALEGIMTTPVSVAIYASECCGEKLPKDAIAEIDKFLPNSTPYNFDQTAKIVTNLQAKNPQLADAFIGISQNSDKLIAFTLDTKNHISKVELSASWKIYTQ